MMLGLAGLLGVVGCGKEEPAAPSQQGVTIDLPKLQEAFTSASPDLQASVAEVAQGIRYGEHAAALAALAKLAANPNLTEPQKKIVGEVTEQLKQVASKAPAPPPR